MLENHEESDRKIVIIMLESLWEMLMIDMEIGFRTRCICFGKSFGENS